MSSPVTIEEIESIRPTVDISAHGGRNLTGPYELHIEVTVQAPTYQRAVQIVEGRLEQEFADER